MKKTTNKKQVDFSKLVPKNFDSPEKIPDNKRILNNWQSANRNFWESNPMRYDWKEKNSYNEGSVDFYNEIDKIFFGEIKAIMPWKKKPFDNLVDFNTLKDKSVLEIGVGVGSHAALIAPCSRSYTGIDLTEYAFKMTSKRMRLNALKSNYKIIQMNAEFLEFPDNSFDLVWSWGVIHHSANTRNILREVHRVLKPGGSAKIMVYYRGWWNYYVVGFLFHGIMKGGFLKYKTLAGVIQANTDGAIARYYSIKSWRMAVSEFLSVKSVFISGNRADLFPIPAGVVKTFIIKVIPNILLRFFLSNFRMGSFLISELKKDQKK
jgi:ubiquinone/menaquinone biosynthesis C-methylase UbiE